jgi:hypothetical protein
MLILDNVDYRTENYQEQKRALHNDRRVNWQSTEQSKSACRTKYMNWKLVEPKGKINKYT